MDRLEGFVSYKDNAIGVSSVEEVRVRISTTGLEGDQPAMRTWVLEGIGSMQMAVWAM